SSSTTSWPCVAKTPSGNSDPDNAINVPVHNQRTLSLIRGPSAPPRDVLVRERDFRAPVDLRLSRLLVVVDLFEISINDVVAAFRGSLGTSLSPITGSRSASRRITALAGVNGFTDLHRR